MSETLPDAKEMSSPVRRALRRIFRRRKNAEDIGNELFKALSGPHDQSGDPLLDNPEHQMLNHSQPHDRK